MVSAPMEIEPLIRTSNASGDAMDIVESLGRVPKHDLQKKVTSALKPFTSQKIRNRNNPREFMENFDSRTNLRFHFYERSPEEVRVGDLQ